MLHKVSTYFKEGFCYAALEISGSEDGTYYSYLELKKAKGLLVVSNSKPLTGLDELPKILKKNTPLFICINTSSVLTKINEGMPGNNYEALVNRTFPNLDLNNFYFEVVPQVESSIVSILKREAVEKILEELRSLKIPINGFSLGISGLSHILPYLNDGMITTSTRQVQVNGRSILAIKSDESSTSTEYDINGLSLKNNDLLAFSQIIGYLGNATQHTNFGDVVDNLKWEFKNHRIFNQVLKYALAFFIVLLLTNFFIYNSYHEKVGEQNAAMAATSSKKDEVMALDASVKRKQERVETLSSASNSKATYYLDVLAQNIPNSILLSELKYQPLAKPVRESKPIILENEILLISGISKDVNEFSQWVEEIEKLSWVESVETLDYDFVTKKTSNFLIEIGFHAD